ncbi:MAG: pyridoxamine 5'-phosphate oxidase [Kiritimatiellia bacterium]|jgi:pyridoxamine 5'-phosphate oxidase|nr:pyridoxamine 5'-phosphate oxidase [Kiritimatiellia bacterium]MDP6809163.1 pyridoxamine 5'-phosphate oxidase [Kiritimatiellia bacterium]
MHEQNPTPNPIDLVSTWLTDADDHPLHGGVTLATVGPDGRPSARIVLLRGHDERGFVFYTNYRSRKAEELQTNPQAAMVLWWRDLKQQVRIEGRVNKVSREESEVYFASRPRGHQLGAWVSKQSRVIPDRAVLNDGLTETRRRFENRDIPCPPHWGGYRLSPDMIEFWEEGEHRLHDRLRYRRQDGEWRIERLAP